MLNFFSVVAKLMPMLDNFIVFLVLVNGASVDHLESKSNPEKAKRFGLNGDIEENIFLIVKE